MKRFNGKSVLITGASAGIGRALAHQFADEGAELILLARRAERLEELAAALRTQGATTHVYRCDVTQPDELSRVVRNVVTNGGKLDIVIANAGFGVMGKCVQLTTEDYRRQFETNIFGVLNTLYATHAELKRTAGTLVLIGSIAGYVTLPGASAYSMSKFALRALAATLQAELAADHINVTLISSGFVDSDIRRTDNHGRYHQNAVDPLPQWIRVPTAKAARLIATAVYRKRRERVISAHGKLVVFLSRHVPGLLRLLMGSDIKSRPEAGQ